MHYSLRLDNFVIKVREKIKQEKLLFITSKGFNLYLKYFF